MNIWKKAGIIVGSIIIAVYVLFLLAPLALSPILNKHASDIEKIAQDSTGLKFSLQKMKVVTTPKLTAGIKIGHADILTPENDKVVSADNFQLKLSLLPILARKITIDKISADNVDADLKIEKDGKFQIEKYFPQPETVAEPVPMQPLPFGIKLSNRLPDIKVDDYKLAFVDAPTGDSYELSGEEIKIADFILNKKIKVEVDGKFTLKGRTQFNYDIEIFNKIMPDVNLNDLVFNPEPAPAVQVAPVNIIDILKAIHANKLTANAKADLKISGTAEEAKMDGFVNVDNISVVNLPPSNMKMNFKGDKIDLNAKLYTAKYDLTELIGKIKTGKSPNVDLTCKSNAGLGGIVELVKSLARSFGVNDLNTLTATGVLDINFNVKSDMKKLQSSGRANLNSGKLVYGLYGVTIENINANVALDNNNVNIKKAGFSILGNPLNLYGTIDSDAVADLHVIADKLQIKGLLAALGQAALLKDNAFNSGTLSLDVSVKGRLDKPEPKVDLSVDNVNVKNIPAATTITLANADIDVIVDGEKINGLVNVKQLNLINPSAHASIPSGTVTIKDKDIQIKAPFSTDLLSYADMNIASNIKLGADDLKLSGTGLYSGSNPLVTIAGSVSALSKVPVLGLNISIPNQIETGIAGFKGSKVVVKADIGVNGSVNNPAINGEISVPTVSLPSIKTYLKNINVVLSGNAISVNCPDIAIDNSKMSGKGVVSTNFNNGITVNTMTFNADYIDADTAGAAMMGMPAGPAPTDLGITVLSGKGNISKLKSGGIIAQNLSGDFTLKNSTAYITNINGDAFSGKVKGNVSYGVLNEKIGVDMTGSGMDAVKAIEGAAGIKNALSGDLNWNAKINARGIEYNAMMKSLTGKVSFNIDNGMLLNVGRLETMLGASNITNNVIMRTALSGITAIPAIKSTADFKYIKGDMTFNNGWANLNPINMSGPSMAYNIKGQYNLLNGSANLIVLGRLSSAVVGLLGPIGDLSVDKLTSYIPKFGPLTAAVIKTMTTDPASENVAAIPALSSGSKYKDFKVVFNGGIQSQSSVKSFKWLSKLDPADIEKLDPKQQIKDSMDALNQLKKTTVGDFKQSAENLKQQGQNVKQQAKDVGQQFKDAGQQFKNTGQQFKDAGQQFKDMKNIFKQPVQ